MHTIASTMPADAVIVEEAPSHRNALHDHLTIRTSGGFYACASGGLGFGLPAAVGVALADASRKVIAVLGDGSSLYTIQGLWTAAQHRLPITFVILNNSGYGAVKSLAARMGLAQMPGSDVPGVDFVRRGPRLRLPGDARGACRGARACLAAGLRIQRALVGRGPACPPARTSSTDLLAATICASGCCCAVAARRPGRRAGGRALRPGHRQRPRDGSGIRARRGPSRRHSRRQNRSPERHPAARA